MAKYEKNNLNEEFKKKCASIMPIRYKNVRRKAMATFFFCFSHTLHSTPPVLIMALLSPTIPHSIMSSSLSNVQLREKYSPTLDCFSSQENKRWVGQRSPKFDHCLSLDTVFYKLLAQKNCCLKCDAGIFRAGQIS